MQQPVSDTAVFLATRPYTPADAPFVFTLYETMRAMEMSLVDWDDARKEQFLRAQFDAQQQHYTTNFPDADHDIILFKDEPIGRIYVDRSGQEIRLLDIVLLPPFRNRGIGAIFLEQLKQEGQTAVIPVRFYVWQLNDAAQRFYRRHDFEIVKEEGAYVLMEWLPTAAH